MKLLEDVHWPNICHMKEHSLNDLNGHPSLDYLTSITFTVSHEFLFTIQMPLRLGFQKQNYEKQLEFFFCAWQRFLKSIRKMQIYNIFIYNSRYTGCLPTSFLALFVIQHQDFSYEIRRRTESSFNSKTVRYSIFIIQINEQTDSGSHLKTFKYKHRLFAPYKTLGGRISRSHLQVEQHFSTAERRCNRMNHNFRTRRNFCNSLIQPM